ncbi:MAG: class I tRNA ligase family protein, partial [Polyangiaceae bacterium]
GTDALRWALCSYSPQSKRIPLSLKKIEGSRHFCNKIWNATRYALPYLEGVEVPAEVPEATSLLNRWILVRLGAACGASKEGIDAFRFDDSCSALYRFFWGELCDWYLELSKPVFAGDDETAKAETRQVLLYALDTALRAMHPFIPFITEELWHRLPRAEGAPVSVALTDLPGAEAGRQDAEASEQMDLVQAVITAARTVRSERNMHPASKVALALRHADDAVRGLLERERQSIETLVKTETLVIEPPASERPKGAALSVASGIEVLITLRGVVDAEKERARVEREITKTEKDIAVIEKKLSNKKFAERAPAEVVAEAKSDLEQLKARRALLDEAAALAAEL